MTDHPTPSCRFVVADDSRLCRQILLLHLDRYGFVADSVASGEAVLEKVSKNLYSGIFLDLGMSGVSGLDVARIIRSGDLGPDNADTLLICVSSEECVHVRPACRAVGFDWYLQKPVTTVSLRTTLRHCGFIPPIRGELFGRSEWPINVSALSERAINRTAD